MRDEARFPVVHCKLTEATWRAYCEETGRAGAWQVDTPERLKPIGPKDCLEASSSGRIVLFSEVMRLGINGMTTDAHEERINMSPDGKWPGKGE